MKRAALLGVVVLSCFGVGCGGGPVGTGDSTTVSIGTTGGTVELEGARLEIPAGALTETASITVTSTTDAAPDGFTALSPVFRFEPAGLVFAEPVTASLAFSGDASRAVLYWSQSDGPGFDDLGGTVAGGRVDGMVSHFSSGFVGLAPEAPDAGIDADLSCAPGETVCSSGCTSTMSDPANCGICEHACALGQACISGQCGFVAFTGP